MIPLALIPDELKQQLWDNMLNFLARHADSILGERIGQTINKLTSQAAFNQAFDVAMENAVQRFSREYILQDEDLVLAIMQHPDFWQSKTTRTALLTLIRRPGAFLLNEQEVVAYHFADVLPQRMNRERVDKAIIYMLRCVAEELWSLPGAREIREVYNLQFQKITAEAARQQVALLEAQVQAMKQVSGDVREALVQLASLLLERHVLASPTRQFAVSVMRPYHNLPQPAYVAFIGRQKEQELLMRHLAPQDRAWQMVITGIGGVGKSSLALNIAHYYRQQYQQLAQSERFEALIWITAKEDILTISGRMQSSPPGLVLHSLEDMYTTIAQTLEREDITRALPQEQDHLVRKALGAQRTLLIVDNLESVTDPRVKAFLYHLPEPTKCLITSREWVDVAIVLRLTGLPFEEAKSLIREEATLRQVALEAHQYEQLIKRTEGLPLPIQLSVARLASGETFPQVLRWLGDARGNLPEYCVKGQIDIVYQRHPQAWKMLLVCSLFDQSLGASRDALRVITDSSLADQEEGLTLLQRLSLLNQNEDGRFWMLPTVQVYAADALLQSDDRETSIQRWLSYLIAFIEAYGVNLEFHCENARIIEQEYQNLLGAIRWCREHHYWQQLIRLAEGTWFYPFFVGLFSEMREILEAAIKAAQKLTDERSEGRFTRRLGLPLWVQRYYDGDLARYLERAERIAQKYQDEIELGLINNMYWDILYHEGRLDEAERTAQSTLAIGERWNNLELKTKAAYRFAELAAQKQQFDLALSWLERGDEWARGLNWSRRLAWNMYLRGTIQMRQGDVSAAEHSLKQSLHIGHAWGDRRLIAYNVHELTRIYVSTSQFRIALEMAEEACDLYERLGMVKNLADIENLMRKIPGGWERRHHPARV